MERRSFLARVGATLAALPFLPKFAQAETPDDVATDVLITGTIDERWGARFARHASRTLKHRGIRVVFRNSNPDRLRFGVEDTTDWRGLTSRWEGTGIGLNASFIITLASVKTLDPESRNQYIARQAKYQVMKCAESIEYTRRTGMMHYYDDAGIERTVPYWAVPAL